MNYTEYECFIRSLEPGGLASARNVELLSKLSLVEREVFALKSKTMVLYVGDEVAEVIKAEEDAALSAMPAGHSIEQLNGLNIGCGDRLISEYLLPIDIMRHQPSELVGGEHSAFTKNAFLARPDNLPFKDESIDFIVSLHLLEHLENPIHTVHHWLDLIKPGGGVGVVVPDWRYTWDSRSDDSPFGHRWNPTPQLISNWYQLHWEKRCYLEKLQSYRFKLSFNFVLRKHGVFKAFSPTDSIVKSGHQRFLDGTFLQGE